MVAQPLDGGARVQLLVVAQDELEAARVLVDGEHERVQVDAAVDVPRARAQAGEGVLEGGLHLVHLEEHLEEGRVPSPRSAPTAETTRSKGSSWWAMAPSTVVRTWDTSAEKVREGCTPGCAAPRC